MLLLTQSTRGFAARDTKQSIPKAPYLYYYSHLLNAFVIERADGSDSRVFGAGVMPDGYWVARRGLWSPSHRWFAWIAGQYVGQSFNERLWLISADGKQRVRTVEYLRNIFEVAWSPTADLLLINAGATLYLVDPDTQKVVAQFHTLKRPNGTNDYALNLKWADDGRFATFNYSYWERKEQRTNYVDYEGIIYADGRIDVHIVGEQSSNDSSVGCEVLRFTPWRSGNWAAYLSPDQRALSIQNDQTNQSFVVQSNGEDIVDVAWQPGERYVLVYTTVTHCPDTSNMRHIGVLSVAQRQISFLPGNFLPQAAPYDLREPYLDRIQTWSPDGLWALLRMGETAFSLLSLSMVSIVSTFSPNTSGLEAIGFSYGSKIYWTADSQQIVFNLNGNVYSYDVNGKQFTFLYQSILYNISPNRHYVAFNPIHSGFVDALQVEDRQTGQITYLTPYSGSERIVFGVIWHPTESWLLTQTFYTLAGGGGVLYPMYTVANVEGTIQRELTKQSFIDWMPFDPPPNSAARSTSVIGQPALALFGHTDVIHDLAWSPDGKRLASASHDGTIRIWDTVTGQILQILRWAERGSLTAHNGSVAPYWLPDSVRLLSVVDSGQVLWNTTTGERLQPENWDFATELVQAARTRTGTPTSSPNGKWSIIDNELQETATLRAIRSFADQQVTTWIGDDQFIVENKWNGTSHSLQMQDVLTGDVLVNFQNVDAPDDQSRTYFLSPDGHWLVGIREGVSLNGDFQLWDTTTGRAVATCTSGGSFAGWSPDGTRIAVATAYGVQIWSVPELLSHGMF